MKIIIASTEKTGNTWLKLLLAHIYELPTRYLDGEFSPAQADRLGPRWIAHQHFVPDRALLDWAAAREVRFLTTIRNPAATLVSLYHYCRNYPRNYETEFEIASALRAETHSNQPVKDENLIPDGPLVRILQRRLMCDLNISISWILSGRSLPVRYEELHSDSLTTLTRLTASLQPVSLPRIKAAITHCQLDALRKRDISEQKFFRRGSVTEWNAVLPTNVYQCFIEEEPYKSQCAFLGYDLQRESALQSTPSSDREEKSKKKPILVVPILRQLLETIGVTKQTWFPEYLLSWANAPADTDSNQGRTAIPLISNLAAFIHRLRPDLQSAFPDIFAAHRVGYAIWFLRYAEYSYQLDQRFFIPVALSWLRRDGRIPSRERFSEDQRVWPGLSQRQGKWIK